MGYSRKALYADAAAASLAGMDGVLQKPQGTDDQAIAEATRRAAPELAEAAYRAVDRRLFLKAAPLAFTVCKKGREVDFIQSLRPGVATARRLA